ncbi:MAG TPA: DUF47 family protein [Ignavibacteriaceae bacterium]|nr:DUF47 family protein [Ignavibacteriaceae bacterium]
MFKKLLPKEEKYFDNFKEMIAHIVEMAQLTHQLFSSEIIDRNILLKIKPLELRCEEITSKVVKRLNKTYITPFDREDIFGLIKRLNDISDMLLGATTRVETYNITSSIKYADKLSSIVVQQVEELGIAIQDLKVKRVNEMKAVKVLETEADSIYRQAVKELFEEEKNAIELIKRKEVLDILENTSDRCQSTANIIIGLFIKNT